MSNEYQQEAIREVLPLYPIDDNISEVEKVEKATQSVFRFNAGSRHLKLKQFSQYSRPDDLKAEFQLSRLLSDKGVAISSPISSKDGELFVEVDEKLWALFPWYEGVAGDAGSTQDLEALASAQGKWVAACANLEAEPEWHSIRQSARKYRQRKDWAWVVPLDEIPVFAEEHGTIENAAEKDTDCPHHKKLNRLLPDLRKSLEDFRALLEENRVSELPRSVSHGDFRANNILIGDDGERVIDLDCFSYEPRITDFARAARDYYKNLGPDDGTDMLEAFQENAKLDEEEVAALPLMICALDMYYAVMHTYLFLGESPANREKLLKKVGTDMRACERYRNERDEIMAIFK